MTPAERIHEIAVLRQNAGKPVSKGHFLGIGLMTLLNAAVAVFWR